MVEAEKLEDYLRASHVSLLVRMRESFKRCEFEKYEEGKFYLVTQVDPELWKVQREVLARSSVIAVLLVRRRTIPHINGPFDTSEEAIRYAEMEMGLVDVFGLTWPYPLPKAVSPGEALVMLFAYRLASKLGISKELDELISRSSLEARK